MPHECTDCGQTFADGSKEMLSGCPNCGGTTFQFRPEGVDTPDAEPPEPPEPAVDGVARTVGSAASTVRNLVTGSSSGRPQGNQIDTPESERSIQAGPGEDHESQPGSTGTETSSNPPPDESDREQIPPNADDAIEIDSTELPPWPGEADSNEDAAQSSARRDIVHADELPASPASPRNRPPVPDPRPLSARPEEAETPATEDASEIEDAETSDETESQDDADGLATHDPAEPPTLSQLRDELNDQFESIRVVEPGQYELNLMELYDREEYIIALQEDGRYSIQLPERWDER